MLSKNISRQGSRTYVHVLEWVGGSPKGTQLNPCEHFALVSTVLFNLGMCTNLSGGYSAFNHSSPGPRHLEAMSRLARSALLCRSCNQMTSKRSDICQCLHVKTIFCHAMHSAFHQVRQPDGHDPGRYDGFRSALPHRPCSNGLLSLLQHLRWSPRVRRASHVRVRELFL